MWNLKSKQMDQQNKKRLKNRGANRWRKGQWGNGKNGEGDWEVQTSSYKINKSQRCNVNTSIQSIIL